MRFALESRHAPSPQAYQIVLYDAATGVPLPGHEPTGGKDAINRAVFARYRQEMDAAHAAVSPIDYDAYTEEFERLYRETPDFLEQMEAAFAEWMRVEEADHGPWIAIPGHGQIRERTYTRLWAQVTGERNATAPTA